MSLRSAFRGQAGYSLVELLVAMTMGLFVMAGILSVLLTVYRTSQGQNQTTQLANNAYFALNLLTQTIQASGYIPDPTTESTSTAMPATALYAQAGQFISGTYGGTTQSDTLSVRYVSGLINDQIGQQDTQINCIGRGLPTGVVANNPSTFYIFDQTLQVDTNGNLVCMYTGETFNPQTQVTTITEPTSTYTLLGSSNNKVFNQLSVLYGVDTNGDGSVDTYENASQVTNWSQVLSVQIILVLNNPLAAQAGQPATLTYSKTIPLMNHS